MPYGTNGLNSDGTFMNVGNTLSERPSIRLLGREKGYETGHAMAALLGIGGGGGGGGGGGAVKKHQRHRRSVSAESSDSSSLGHPEPSPSTPAFRVGMKVLTTRHIDLHSGVTVPPGVVGIVCKAPGDIKGTVAEVDIFNGPLFDAWPGTVAPLSPADPPPPSVPSLDLSFSRGTSTASGASKMRPAGVGTKKCRNCRAGATAFARFCTNCGLSI